MSKRRKRKKSVFLDHEQKREIAKRIIAGKMVKQIAADYNISVWQCYTIVNDYTILTRTERYPDQ